MYHSSLGLRLANLIKLNGHYGCRTLEIPPHSRILLIYVGSLSIYSEESIKDYCINKGQTFHELLFETGPFMNVVAL